MVHMANDRCSLHIRIGFYAIGCYASTRQFMTDSVVEDSSGWLFYVVSGHLYCGGSLWLAAQ